MIGRTVVGFGLGGALVNLVAYFLAPKVSAQSQALGWYLTFAVIGILGGWSSLLLWSVYRKTPLGLEDPKPGDKPWRWYELWIFAAVLAVAGAFFEMLPFMMAQYGNVKILPQGVWLAMLAPFLILLVSAEIITAFGLVFAIPWPKKPEVRGWIW